jgi:hypothetical protein
MWIRKRGNLKFGFLHDLITWERHPVSCETSYFVCFDLFIKTSRSNRSIIYYTHAVVNCNPYYLLDLNFINLLTAIF